MGSIAELKKQFKERVGYELNLENPKRYCEKIQWRKVNDCRPMLYQLADKISVKYYLKQKISRNYLVPYFWYTYDKPAIAEIKGEMLGDCIIKASHGCAWMLFQGANGERLPADKIQEYTDYWMGHVYGQDKMQWAESKITPGILVEKYMTYKDGQCPLVKVYCFNGVAKLGEYIEHGKHRVDQRADPATVTFYDPRGERLLLSFDHIPSTMKPAPDEYAECVKLSEKLTKGIDHLRVDWLLTDDGPKFSEFTWYPTSGMFKLNPPEMDAIMGEWWRLPWK